MTQTKNIVEVPSVSWEYFKGEELGLYWINPWDKKKEKIATFWWPAHPVEATEQMEMMFEEIAKRATSIAVKPEENESLRAELLAKDAVIAHLEKALIKIDEQWFQPIADNGVCSSCDGGMDPRFIDRHEPRCVLQTAHEALAQAKEGA